MRTYYRAYDEYEDLLQEARIAFLEHIRSMESDKETRLCKFQLYRTMCDWCVEMAPVRIPRNRCKEEIGRFHTVPLEETEDLSFAETFEEWVSAEITVKSFLNQLTPEERRVVDMKLQGYNGREIS